MSWSPSYYNYLQVCEVLLQNHLRFQQNFHAPTLALPFAHTFSDPHFRRRRYCILPPRNAVVKLIYLLGHPQVVVRGEWGFEKKTHVTGYNIHDEHRLQAQYKSVDGFYSIGGLRLDKIKRTPSRWE